MKCAANYTIAIIKDGENGKGIVSITRYWGISNSMTTPPSSFSETKPERSEGEFLWAKDITKYTDNTTTETEAFVITGDSGDGAKMLLLSSDYPSFTINSSGEVSPDEITVNVKKSGISDSTEFSVSNGMAIANDSSEIKITPYMAGLSKIKLTNLAAEPIDNTNSIYNFITPPWDDTRSYDSDTHTITFTNLSAATSFMNICTMRISLAQVEEIKQKGFVGIIILDEFEATSENLSLNIFFERRYIKGDGSYGYVGSIAPPIDRTLENEKTFVFYLTGESFRTPSDFAHWDENYDYYTIMVRIQGTKAGDTISIKARDLRIIPLPVNLEEAFPYFASLEYADKVEVLKTIPYFTGEMVLGNKLTNLLQYDHVNRSGYNQTSAPYDEATHEWLFDFGAIENPSDEKLYYVKGKDNLYEHYSFVSLEASFTAGDTLPEDAKFAYLCSIESSTRVAGDITSKVETNAITEDYKKFSTLELANLTETRAMYIFAYVHPTIATPISKFLDSTLKLRNLVGIDLSATGWYTFFKLMGATDQAIYDWCNSLPFFENSYEVPVEPIKITATAGEYKDSIVISCTDIQPVSFEINVSPNTYPMTSRQYVASPSTLTLACNKKNYNLSNQAVWTIAANDNIYFSNDSGTKIEGTTYTGDNAFITIAKECTTVAFKIACSLEGLGTREFTVSGAYPDFTPAYLGTVDATLGQSFPTVVEGKGPIKEGDMVVYITQDADGKKTSNYYVCQSVGTSGVGTWVPYIADSHHNSELMISGIYDAIMSGSQNASMVEMIKQLVAQYIAAQYIRITGAIFGGDRFELDGDDIVDTGSGIGFLLQAKSGVLKAWGAELSKIIVEGITANDAFISGELSCEDDVGVIFKTNKGSVETKNISCSSPTHWNSNNALSLISPGSSGDATYNGTGYKFKRTNSSNMLEINRKEYSGTGSWWDTISLSITAPYSGNYKLRILNNSIDSDNESIITIKVANKTIYSWQYLNWKELGEGNYKDWNFTVKKGENIYYEFDIPQQLSSGKNFATISVYFYNESNITLYSSSDPLNGVEILPNTIYPKATKLVLGSTFNSDSYIRYASPKGWANGLNNVDSVYMCKTGTKCVLNGISRSVSNVRKTSSELIVYTTEIGYITFKLTDYYYISGTLQLISSERGNIVETLMPANDDSSLGTGNSPFLNGYIKNMYGNVNVQGTSNVVWGAVFN